MNVTDALEVVLEFCESSLTSDLADGVAWDLGYVKEVRAAMLRLDRKLQPLLWKRLLRSGKQPDRSTSNK